MPTFALSFPLIDPVTLDLGVLQIRWYALAYLAGLLLGWRLCLLLARRDKELFVKATHFSDFLGWAALGIVLGGRLGYCLLYKPKYYLAQPVQILFIWQGGMAFHGGFLGFCLSAWLYARRHGLCVLRLADYLAVAAPIGLFFGRIANFINAELYGRPSDLPWAVIFPASQDGQASGLPLSRHPSQIYEALLEGVLLFVVLYLAHQSFSLREKPGLVTGIFMLGYGVARFFVEFFRQYDVALGLIAGWMSHGQLYSLPLMLFGALLIFSSSLRAK